MKPISFRTRKYRNIDDSGEVSLADHLTCVVGKNQSGKTSLLKALHKFNPHEPEPYDIRRDWPRGERKARSEAYVVCEVKFELEREEIERLEHFAEATVTARHVTIGKDYAGKFEFTLDASDEFAESLHPNDVDAITAALPECPADVGDDFRSVADACLAETRRLAREGRFTELAEQRTSHEKQLQGAIAGPPQPQQTAFAQQYLMKLDEIRAVLAETPTPYQRAHDFLISRIPTFIYMDDYQEFSGTALLDQVRDRSSRNRASPEDRTFLMILELAGLNIDDVIEAGRGDEEDRRERQHDVDDGARTLTREVTGRWGQNPYRVEFRVDEHVFLVEIEETEKNIGMIPLEEQSKGFRWFFSFDLRFMHDSEGTFEGCVLLLDEPGLHLHPGAQHDLLARLDAYASKNTLIYTTHLPFLVDLREPTRIRVMSDADGHATVIEDLTKSGKDEKLTLQAALGMKLNQHYLVAERNLIVEGVDDFWIITELSNLSERSGEQGLPEDVLVSAAGGAPEVVYMATFMLGNELTVVALLDSDDAGRVAEEKLRTKWLTRYKDVKGQTVLLGEAVGAPGDFAIEDLFPEDFYLDRVYESHRKKLAAAGVSRLGLPGGSGLLCRRVQSACEDLGVSFKLIRRDLRRMDTVDALPDERTRQHVGKLITKLRAQFEREGS